MKLASAIAHVSDRCRTSAFPSSRAGVARWPREDRWIVFAAAVLFGVFACTFRGATRGSSARAEGASAIFRRRRNLGRRRRRGAAGRSGAAAAPHPGTSRCGTRLTTK